MKKILCTIVSAALSACLISPSLQADAVSYSKTTLYFSSDTKTISKSEISSGSVTIPIEIYVYDADLDVQSIRAKFSCDSQYVTLKNIINPTKATDVSSAYTTSLGETFTTNLTPFCYSHIESGALVSDGSFNVSESNASNGEFMAFTFTRSLKMDNGNEIKEYTTLGAKSDEFMLTGFEAEFAQNTPAGNYTINFSGDTGENRSYYNSYNSKVTSINQKPITIRVGYLPGDVDENGVVDAIDASLALTSYALVSTGQSSSLSSSAALAADVNMDTIVDAIDASSILSYYASASTGQNPSFD